MNENKSKKISYIWKRLSAFFLAISAALDGRLKLGVDAGATLTYSLEREKPSVKTQRFISLVE